MRTYLFQKSVIGFLLSVYFIPLIAQEKEYSGNPLFRDIFTADPCALVYHDTLYIFTGHDEQTQLGSSFLMRDWHIFSTADMVNWTSHGAKLKVTDFSWASGNAFAGHVTEHNGKFYWYVSATHKFIRKGEGFAIGVAVSDHPLGPYKDATGEPLITDNTLNSITLNIDPAVYVDNGIPWLFWGSWGEARMVKLKENMTELDGNVRAVNARDFFEAPWVHKKDNLYYLSYASGYPSTTKYSTSSSINGPWIYRGIINDLLPNSETNHQAIIQFKGNWYFIYHNGALPDGGTYRRSVCIDKLEYGNDSTIKKVVRTSTGVEAIETTCTRKQFLFKNNYENYENSFSIYDSIKNKPWQFNNSCKVNTFNLLGIRKNTEKVSVCGIYIFTPDNKKENKVKQLLIYK